MAGLMDTAFRRAGLPARVVGAPFRMTVAFEDEDPERRILMRTLLVQELARRGVLTWKASAIPSLAHGKPELRALSVAFEESAAVLGEASRRNAFLEHLALPDDV